MGFPPYTPKRGFDLRRGNPSQLSKKKSLNSKPAPPHKKKFTETRGFPLLKSGSADGDDDARQGASGRVKSCKPVVIVFQYNKEIKLGCLSRVVSLLLQLSCCPVVAGMWWEFASSLH